MTKGGRKKFLPPACVRRALRMGEAPACKNLKEKFTILAVLNSAIWWYCKKYTAA
jgi:hypothetical protein